MDKNKAAFKLQNIPPIYYINIDGQPDRKEYVEEHFAYWGITNYERISGYDGRDDDLSDVIKGRYPERMTSGEVGCTTSHLKAIKHWYDTSDEPYALIMEDDINLDIVKHWSFTWREFMSKTPYDWDVIQLAIICTGALHVKLHRRFVNDFSLFSDSSDCMNIHSSLSTQDTSLSLSYLMFDLIPIHCTALIC